MAVTETGLNTRRDELRTVLKDLTDNPLPSYKRGTLTMSWSDYHKLILDELRDTNKQLALLPCAEVTIYDDPSS